MKIVTINSPYPQCGVREYGLQLNRSLSKISGVELANFTYSNDIPYLATSADLLFVHFEDGFLTKKFHSQIAAVAGKVKIVFCCHRYARDVAGPFLPLVDRFVLHRQYGDAPENSVEIPLGCPIYEPIENRSQIRARLKLPQDRTVVTSLGFLASWKQWPAISAAVVRELPNDAFLQIHATAPFSANKDQIGREENTLNGILSARGRLTTEFLPERDLLDLVYASDLGFVFHPIHTGSVSAATKQFVSTRCPLIVTESSHASDLTRGVVRVASLDASTFAREVSRVACNVELRSTLSSEMQNEYMRLNMDTVAARYVELFKEVLG